jgi:hypothetical protein
MRAAGRLACLLGVLSFFPAEAARAQALVPVSVSWKTVNGVRGIEVARTPDGVILMAPNGQPILTATPCETELELQPAAGGFDLLVVVRNPTAAPQPRPTIALTGLRLEPKLTWLDARRTGALMPWDARGASSKWSSRFEYPDHLYAPVLALIDSRVAVGVSFIYDVLEERHAMSTFWGMEGGAFHGTYRVELAPFADEPSDAGALSNLVPPGRTQRYRIAVRFAAPDRWLETLEPYREHFQARYGAVRYQADLTPVWGEPVAQAEFRGEHPRGYNPAWRVDATGWGSFVDHVLERVVSKGYRRVMIWAASGLYGHDDSYPVEFMTEWSPAMIASAAELQRLRNAGVTVGLWWGQAGQVSAGFASGRIWNRRLSRQEDIDAGDRELRLASGYQIDEIGLDAINAMPLWERYPWVQRIQAAFPTLKFITETHDCDVMHTIVPTFYNWRDHDTAPILPDWLNTGHETWVQLWYNESDTDRFERIRGWGLVPVTMSTVVPHNPRRN